jgi:hypothetical protein
MNGRTEGEEVWDGKTVREGEWTQASEPRCAYFVQEKYEEKTIFLVVGTSVWPMEVVRGTGAHFVQSHIATRSSKKKQKQKNRIPLYSYYL